MCIWVMEMNSLQYLGNGLGEALETLITNGERKEGVQKIFGFIVGLKNEGLNSSCL